MSMLRSILIKIGLADFSSDHTALQIFILDDDERRHRWFKKRFKGDQLEIAETVEEAKRILEEGKFDAIFLDHDLLPHHYESNDHDDFQNTGFAVAEWLAKNAKIQPSAMIIVHTRNNDGGSNMAEKLREGKRHVEYVPFNMLDFKIQQHFNK
ncbi:MAG: cyclic-phosphate processing receiver domain-containing protein [Aridibacter sp.]